MDERDMMAAAASYKAKGQQVTIDAGYGGRMDDAGGGRMVEVAEAFICGLQKRLPPSIEKHAAELAMAEASERDELARLKKKYPDA